MYGSYIHIYIVPSLKGGPFVSYARANENTTMNSGEFSPQVD